MGTTEPVNLFLGFDPGGKDNFGWSICREAGGLLQPCPVTGLADDAWDAITQVKDKIASLYPQRNSCVRAAGIDAPLKWNKRGDSKGYRKADCELRKVLEDTGGPVNRVLASNSLVGAVVVQGPLLVRHLSETRDLTITESHPKALECLVNHTGQRQMVKSLTARLVTTHKKDPTHHERDATLSAVSAWAAIYEKPPKWQNLYDWDPDLFNPSQLPVGYWMPIPASFQFGA